MENVISIKLILINKMYNEKDRIFDDIPQEIIFLLCLSLAFPIDCIQYLQDYF